MDRLIDTHCHLNDPSFKDTIGEVLKRARRAGVTGCVVPAYDRESLSRTLEIARLYPETILPAFGVHPWFVEEKALQELEYYLELPETAALGEAGLDFSEGMPPSEIQESFFTAQLEMAAEHSLPVLVHCRRAHEQVYRMIAPYRGRMDIVMHSFSGSLEMMKRFVDLGCYIAFSGSVTRDRAKKYHRCAAAVPLDRLLIETDAPSIATRTTVASEVEPAHASEVALKIADLREISLSEACRSSTSNARRIFGDRLK